MLRGHRGIVGSIEFNSDGTKLASLGTDQVRIWALDLDDLIYIAQYNLTPPSLTTSARSICTSTTA